MEDLGSPQIQYTAKNFGPIRYGEVSLAPLTIFIGPNGSGKTYMATLIYLFTRAVAEAVSPGRQEMWATAKSPESITIQDKLTCQDRNFWQKWLSGIPSRVGEQIENLLPGYFGQESAAPLAYKGRDSFQIGFQRRSRPSVFLNGEWHQARGWQWKWGGFDQILLGVHSSSRLWDNQSHLTWSDIYPTLFRSLAPLGDAYFLPSARAGLLQGLRVLIGMAAHMAHRQYRLQAIETTPYFGVSGDFLLTLVEEGEPFRLFSSQEEDVRERNLVRSFLEENILHGRIEWEPREGLHLFFCQDVVKIPLTATPSSLVELAPLDLLLRRGRPSRGDLLVIEEPEARLHLEDQRRIATLIVRLVRMGVYVLCTTHSDIILHQISNHLLLGEALQKGYEIPEFDPNMDRLDYNEVGVYLFRTGMDGSVIEPIHLEPGFGIPQDEFVRVAEAIGSQTYTLLDILAKANGSTR